MFQVQEGVRTVEATELVEIFQEAAKRLSRSHGYGNLIFSRVDRAGRRNIGETDARFVLAGVLDERDMGFGLEVPTKKKYRFRGKKFDRGNLDVVVNPGAAAVIVEAKVRATASHDEFRGLEGDLTKLIKEPAKGAASFHVLQRSSLERLFRGYETAYRAALRRTARLKSLTPKWYVLFILDRRAGVQYWQVWRNITELGEGDFSKGNFNTRP